jgi:hypothetical protein
MAEMKIPLYKLFLIQAAYAIPLAAFCRLGPEGIVSGLIVGTGVSGLILLIRRDKIRSAFKVAVGSIVGVWLVGGCLGIATQRMDANDPEQQAWWGLKVVAFGAVVGGVLTSLFLDRRPLTIFHLHGDPDAILSRLFHGDGDHLQFGFRGRTQTPASLAQVWSDGVAIRDYIMEGFVTYRVRADRAGHGVRLEVQKLGMNRDQYVDACVRHYIQSLGVDVK